jgi:hypothetical protein
MSTKNLPVLTLEGARIALADEEKRAHEIGTRYTAMHIPLYRTT